MPVEIQVMNIQEQLCALMALQRIDSALDEARRKYAQLDQGKKERALYEEAKAAHEAAQEAVRAQETILQDTTLEMQALQEKHLKEEKRLYSGQIKSPRELQDLQAEVEMLARHIDTLSGRREEHIIQLEVVQGREANARQKLQKTGAAYKERIKAFNESAALLRDEASSLKSARAEAVHVPEQAMLERYEAARLQRNGVAIAVVLENGEVCGGCHMTLARNQVQELKLLNSIVVCDNCGRMLCLE